MDYYESKCESPTCGHVWQWIGPKSGYGWAASGRDPNTEGKTCPCCKGPATVGLDHTSPGAQELDGALRGFVDVLLNKKT